MPFGLLADLVVAFHFSWILFLILGGLWGRNNRLVRWVHLTGLTYASLVESFDWYCPLTHLEVWLRRKGAQSGYTESFITHYLNDLIYLDVSHGLIIILTLALCAANLRLYLSRWKG